MLESENTAEFLVCNLVFWLSAEDISILEPENTIITKLHKYRDSLLCNAGTYSSLVFISKQAELINS